MADEVVKPVPPPPSPGLPGRPPRYAGQLPSNVGEPVVDGALIDLLAVAGSGPLVVDPGFEVPDRIHFVHTMDAFEESKTAEYANVNIIGRSEPVLGYSHSGPRVFNIPLHFVATKNPFEEILKPIWLIRSWLYPDYTNMTVPNVPPRVLLVMGAWLSQRCICTRVDITYQKPWGRVTLHPGGPLEIPGLGTFETLGSIAQGSGQNVMPEAARSPEMWHRDSMIPYRVDVNLTLQEVTENTRYTPWGTTWIRRGWDRGSGFF